jgi:hypothetical protein
MEAEGGCYCGALRYKTEGDAMFKGQCHCRECQYGSGGSPNVVMAMPDSGFAYTKGAPASFRRPDLENPVTREFCSHCGTQMVSRAPSVPGAVLIKVGTLDDPAVFGQPQMAIFTIDKQPFHQIPDGLPTFERTPGG